MISRWIDWCASNRFLVFTGTALLVLAGIWCLRQVPLDALPDISDVQVIVHTPWEGQPPNIIEDQVTYPIVTALLAAPHVKAVRAQTMFGDSYVFVVFEDGTDLYWARSRVLEYLQQIAGRLPSAVHPAIGPDATGAGWVYEYADRRSHPPPQPGRPAQPSGLVSALSARNRPRRRRSRLHRRLRSPVSGEPRPQQAARLQHSAFHRDRPRPRQHQRSRRRRARNGRRRIHGSRPRLPAIPRRSRKRSGRRQKRHAGSHPRSRQPSPSAPTSAAESPNGMAKAKPSAASS